MRGDAKQLVFELGHDVRLSEEDFLVSPSNGHAYAAIERWPDWSDRVLMLVGPEGSGKSHLAAIWAGRSGAAIVDAQELTPQIVANLATWDALVIEDVDRAGIDEATLFHLLNLIRERGVFTLITASRLPSVWGLKTADLLSRLRLAPSAELLPPDEPLLKAVLVKLFLDRQLTVDTGVVDYLALRLERSLARAGEIVTILDREALRCGRRITRVMAARILRKTIGEEDAAL